MFTADSGSSFQIHFSLLCDVIVDVVVVIIIVDAFATVIAVSRIETCI